MPQTQTARDRTSLILSALARVDEPDLRAALDRLAGRSETPRPVVSAAHALRRSRTIVDAMARPPYRAVLPFLAASVSDECLMRTIEVLGDSSEDPTREELTEALDTVGSEFPDPTVAVMLVSVGTDDMPASALCLDLVTGNPRWGLAGQATPEAGVDADGEGGNSSSSAVDDADDAAGEPSPPDEPESSAESAAARAEQRDARRRRRQEEAGERRRQREQARRAAEQLRSRRKVRPADPVRAPAPPDEPTRRPAAPARRAAPTLFRRPRLTPSQAREFDGEDPLVGAVVVLWVPFAGDRDDDLEEPGPPSAGGPDVDGAGEDGAEPPDADSSQPVDEESEPEAGKLRPCIVIGVSADHLLVRPGYSDGGRKSRDWTSVPIQRWRQARLDQPTWIGAEILRLPRPELPPTPARLAADDWNALW